MLGAAAGGFALAASGLLLPAWLVEEAAADNHPVRGVQDRKQQRRDKRRHELEHNRRVKRRQRQQGATKAPGAFIKGVRMKVVANYGPLKIKWWWWTVVPYSENFGPLDIAVGGSQTLGKDDLNLAVMFDPKSGSDIPPDGFLYVLARNPVGTPDVSVFYGTGAKQTDVASHQNMDPGVTLSVDAYVYQNVKVRLTIKREKDSDDYKEFTVTVGPQV